VLGGDPPGEAVADRDPHALDDLLLQARGRRRDQLAGREVKHQHRGRVGPERLPGPVEQFRQQFRFAEARQRRVGDRLDVPEAGPQ
jgi:hypothetical protein